jgi:hypothetical protein
VAKSTALKNQMGAFAANSSPVGRRNSLKSGAARRSSLGGGAGKAGGAPKRASLTKGGPASAKAPAAKDEATDEKKEELLRFEEVVREGLDLQKHGRRGKPHIRTVFCPVERPQWVPPGSENFRCVCW